MLTLNQLKQKLTDWFESHMQVNTVIYADDLDFNSNPAILYPVVNIQPVDSSIKGKIVTQRFKIIIGDVQNPNVQNSEQEIWNDCQLIADDFMTFFSDDNDYQGFYMDTDVLINRFSETNTDRTSGVRLVVTIRQVREINTCDLPLKQAPQTITDSNFADEFASEFI